MHSHFAFRTLSLVTEFAYLVQRIQCISSSSSSFETLQAIFGLTDHPLIMIFFLSLASPSFFLSLPTHASNASDIACCMHTQTNTLILIPVPALLSSEKGCRHAVRFTSASPDRKQKEAVTLHVHVCVSRWWEGFSGGNEEGEWNKRVIYWSSSTTCVCLFAGLCLNLDYFPPFSDREVFYTRFARDENSDQRRIEGVGFTCGWGREKERKKRGILILESMMLSFTANQICFPFPSIVSLYHTHTSLLFTHCAKIILTPNALSQSRAVS